MSKSLKGMGCSLFVVKKKGGEQIPLKFNSNPVNSGDLIWPPTFCTFPVMEVAMVGGNRASGGWEGQVVPD